MGKKIACGQKNEPKPIKGKAGSIPVDVQAANDGSNLYLRFTWKQPAASGGEKMDKENPVKLAFMLEDNKIERASQSGCWETCHGDSRTMPDAKDDKKTKYVPGGDVKTGKFYDLIQWKSKGKAGDGYVADKRVMEGGKGLVEAKGEQKGDTWTVTVTRKLAGGGEGDIAMVTRQDLQLRLRHSRRQHAGTFPPRLAGLHAGHRCQGRHHGGQAVSVRSRKLASATAASDAVPPVQRQTVGAVIPCAA